jgi:hypothetical protein
VSSEAKFNVYVLARTGPGMAILPGIFLLLGLGFQAFLGVVVLVSMFIVASLDIRAYLRESVWYRVYLLFLFALWSSLGAASHMIAGQIMITVGLIIATIAAAAYAHPRFKTLEDAGRHVWTGESGT